MAECGRNGALYNLIVAAAATKYPFSANAHSESEKTMTKEIQQGLELVEKKAGANLDGASAHNDGTPPPPAGADDDGTPPPPAGAGEAGADDGKTFDRAYVEKLRAESAKHRTAAAGAAERIDTLERALWAERVKATGRLNDPSDLAYDAAAADDDDALAGQIDALIAAKPYLERKKFGGDVGQHHGAGAAADVSLAGLLRAGA